MVLLVIALACEALLAYPAPLFRAIGHPVSWLGALIASFEAHFNNAARSDPWRKAMGCVLVAILLIVSLVSGLALELLSSALRPWTLVIGFAALFSLIAAGSLDQHVRAVPRALQARGIEGGREAVSMIVGRDVQVLDEPAICRAAIESLAENASDGVIAPVFWFVVAGLPGLIGYKAINTADSMVGHKSERYRAFGWAAARLDDLINLPASRITAFLIVAAALIVPGTSPGDAMQAIFRDASRHRSPNAGWPEAAMAGALGLRLAGPRIYDGVEVSDSWMGNGRIGATGADIKRALWLYRAAMGIGMAILLVLTELLTRG